MHYLFQTSVSIGCATPFTFADLMSYAEAGKDAAVIVKRLLAPFWQKWFIDDPNAERTVIPRHAGLLIHRALETLQLNFEDSKKMKVDARQAYASMAEDSAKRTRIK